MTKIGWIKYRQIKYQKKLNKSSDFHYIRGMIKTIFLIQKTNTHTKATKLNSVLSNHFEGKINAGSTYKCNIVEN